MSIRTPRRRLAGALALALALAASALATTTATAAPDALTMVNGEGRTITLPAAATSALRSAAAGSSGTTTTPDRKPSPDLAADSVIGVDGRVQESAPSAFPWGAIAHLETNQGGCTGFMLSRDVLVTAGHCVHSGGSWVTSYRVTPGRTAGSAPFGSCSGGIADVWTTSAWINGYPSDHDYGLVKLTCDIGYQTGWFGWWYSTGENLVGQHFYAEGYPGDKPFGTMWWDGDSTYSQSANKLWYWIDTAPGQSGSPVYHYNSTTPGLCAGWCVTAIHTNGVAGGNPTNSGTRLRPDVMSFINYWISRP
ncbi:trypsin-like serine protease [Actinosynnema pretiosum subsp. pretiosum]|uniref:Serine protease n=1 Tax=Actinosynnema pretiosum subsp. pretiosum TaxID=103721 RepID=A0AA45L5Y0_9PSEU|nr:Glutamyl endopeptidase precursor [Actinosynnema pretiosum subsp. pretiosum]QUF04124.1 trypsin-like serine protease [Actinosynnema pretiosum subsp. pretiosum]